ncbi:condensation domain-containing protein, partial [[Flexibacter] sp. ATCC 35103]|uniref:condensation domain-containing protein n=1 Tax=[Flexibacter] sp. ATCC 35103 TaxID=1937528 RepID=UPI00197FF345
MSYQDSTKNGIPVAKEQEQYPLSSSQYRIWILSQFEEGSIAYNMSGLNTIEGDFDENIFQETFQEILERHEILRASIKTNNDGEVYQSIKSSSDFIPSLTYKDYRDKSTAEIQEIVKASFVAPFDFENDDLIRISVFRTEDNKRLLIISIHHIICDGWSMGILVREFMTIYQSKINRSSYALPKLAIQYKDYAVWQQNDLNSVGQNKQEKYWLSLFDGEIPVLDFPTNRNRPLVKTYNGKRIRRSFNEQVYKKFNSLCLQHEGTVFIGLLTVLNTLLYRYTKQTDIIVGTPVAGRDSVDLENQIGCYINTLALRNVFQESVSFQELFGQIKQSTLASFENQTYPFDSLVKKLNLKHDTSRSVLFDVMLVLQNTNKENSSAENSGNKDQGDFKIEEKVLSKFDMTFNFEEIDSALDVAVEYNTDIFDEAAIDRVLDHFESIMNVVSQSPENPISQIDYLSISEKEHLVSMFDNSNVSYPSDVTIIDIFEEQALKYPDNIAVVFGNDRLTYKELNEASNQLGSYLREQYQTAADDLICINMRPGIRMVISILGILKSGAGYVPINADFP